MHSTLRVAAIGALALLALSACGQAAAPDQDTYTSPADETDSWREGRTTSLAADGLEIAWRSRGSGPATLVLVHGWQCDQGYWREQVDAFGQDYRVVTLDLAGHGASAGGRSLWTMAAFGDDVAAVVQTTASGPVILIGHSMGAPVILEAARRLDNVIGLVAVDSLRGAAVPPASEAEIDAAVAPIEADYQRVVSGFVNSMFVESTPPALRAEIIAGMTAGDPAAAIGMMRGYAQMDYVATLRELDMPLVVINSDYQPTPEERLRELYADLRVVKISNVGHFPMLEAPVRFNALLGETVEELLSQAGVR
jgi:pimeloyl-ACP methyl ester carboxylesterase